MNCYFCGKKVRTDQASKHHILPKRYFLFKEIADQDTNIHTSHKKCHARWHAEYDKLSYDLEMYEIYMTFLDWGKGIYNKLT